MNTAMMLNSRELPAILWTEARRRHATMVLLFAAIAAAGLAAGFLWPKKYSASTTILVQESNIIKPLMEGRAVPTANADRASIAREVIFSRKIMEDILATGGWMASHPSALEQEKLIEDIESRTTITNLRENLIRIEYHDSNPERAFVVAKRLADLFIEESLAAKERESREAYQFISGQVEDYRRKLTDAEDKLKQFRRGNDDARPGSETDTNTRISELRSQIENARMELMEQRSKEHSLEEQLTGESEISAVQTRSGQIRVRLAELRTELDKLLLTYTDRYPDVVRVRHEMQDLRDQLKNAEAQRVAQKASGAPVVLEDAVQFNPLHVELRSKLDEMKRNIAATQSRMSASESMLQSELDRSRRIADSANVLSELTRDYEVNRDIYQDLLKRRENARVSMNLDADHRGLTFTIQEPAALPLRPLGFRLLHFGVAGLGLGLAVPLGLLFALVRWDPRLRSANQLEQVTGLPVLASVPPYTNADDRRRTRTRDTAITLLFVAVIAAYGLTLLLKWTSAL
ncbi:MAG TPA: XrtA system polysaccharide chain length determinant [Rudaea sp.]|nr:XrtA system polysaccharide chain length determinant [Rudaea sp.]